MTNVAKCNRDNTIDKEQQIQEVKNFFKRSWKNWNTHTNITMMFTLQKWTHQLFV